MVAEFDPASTSPMTGQIATEFDSMTGDGDGPDPATERTRPVACAGGRHRRRGRRWPTTPTRRSAPAAACARARVALLVRVLDGPSAGRKSSFSKPEMLFGRVGLQVAALRRTDDRVRLVPVEGALPPSRNGTPVPPEGVELHPGDMFEVAGHDALARPQISADLLPLFGGCDAWRHSVATRPEASRASPSSPFVARRFATIRRSSGIHSRNHLSDQRLA